MFQVIEAFPSLPFCPREIDILNHRIREKTEEKRPLSISSFFLPLQNTCTYQSRERTASFYPVTHREPRALSPQKSADEKSFFLLLHVLCQKNIKGEADETGWGWSSKMLKNQRVDYRMWYTSQALWHRFRNAIINIPNSSLLRKGLNKALLFKIYTVHWDVCFLN